MLNIDDEIPASAAVRGLGHEEIVALALDLAYDVVDLKLGFGVAEGFVSNENILMKKGYDSTIRPKRRHFDRSYCYYWYSIVYSNS